VVRIPNIAEAAKRRPQDFFYYGIAIFGKARGSVGRWTKKFFGNKRFATPQEGGYVIDEEKFKEIQNEPEAGFDYGSLNASWDFMWNLHDLYTKIGVVEEARRLRSEGKEIPYKRDLDPHILQPLQMILPELEGKDLSGLPTAEELRGLGVRKDALKAKLAEVEDVLLPLLSAECKKALATTRDEVLTKEKIFRLDDNFDKEKLEEVEEKLTLEYGPVSEAIWFYLMYRDTDIFALGEQFMGYLDLGANSNWRPYKSALDDVHGQFAMLADLPGNYRDPAMNKDREISGDRHEYR